MIVKAKTSATRVILSAVIGTIGAVVMPLLGLSDAALFFLKLTLAALISLFGAKHFKFKSYLLFFNIFLLLTFALGGAVIGIISLIGIEYGLSSYLKAAPIPAGLGVLACYLVFVFVKKLVKKSAENLLIQSLILDCTVVLNDKKLELKAFFDSGNRLNDIKSGFPIIVCGNNVFAKLVLKGFCFSPPKFLPYSTVSGTANMRLYQIDLIKIKKANGDEIIKNAVLGVTEQMPCLIGDAELLIGADLL